LEVFKGKLVHELFRRHKRSANYFPAVEEKPSAEPYAHGMEQLQRVACNWKTLSMRSESGGGAMKRGFKVMKRAMALFA
jgi:hypothetical protein